MLGEIADFLYSRSSLSLEFLVLNLGLGKGAKTELAFQLCGGGNTAGGRKAEMLHKDP